jgi:hypothetical protein
MLRDNGQMRQTIRALIMAVLALLFVGLILFSIFKVRYPIGKNLKNELYITEQSITDSIHRQGDKLVTANDIPPIKGGKAGSGKKGDTGKKACPT